MAFLKGTEKVKDIDDLAEDTCDLTQELLILDPLNFCSFNLAVLILPNICFSE